MKSFAKNSGRNMIGPDICYNLFSEIDKARSNNLWFTSISGDPYKTVSLNGTSADYPTMLKFLDKLAVSKKIKKPQLLSANLTDKGRVDFEIVVSYKFSKAFAKPKNDNGGDQEQ
jgi:Tfp pilus assembly protein PilN